MPIYPYPHTWSTQHSTPPQRHVAVRSQTEHQSLQSSNYKSIDYSYSTHENSTKTQRMRNLHNTSHYYSSNSTSQHTCLKPNLTPKISLSRSKNHFNKLDLKPKKKKPVSVILSWNGLWTWRRVRSWSRSSLGFELKCSRICSRSAQFWEIRTCSMAIWAKGSIALGFSSWSRFCCSKEAEWICPRSARRFSVPLGPPDRLDFFLLLLIAPR